MFKNRTKYKTVNDDQVQLIATHGPGAPGAIGDGESDDGLSDREE